MGKNLMKELPYFKFYSTEWMTGKIVFESLELQGLFINICALYWKNGGVLKISEIEQRYKKKTLIAKLTDRFFSVNDGFISISFLNEQLIERQEVSKKNSQNGSKGGRPSSEEKKANANPNESDHKPKKSNKELEEERELEEELINENKIFSFDEFWELYPKKVAKEKCKAKFNKLSKTNLQKIKDTIKSFIAYKPFSTYTHPNPETYLNQKRWDDEVKTESLKPNPLAPRPSSNPVNPYDAFR